ncbi:hypothetical protein PF004_g2603 [Phytophthora fragariae]|uniref:Uncharacterized protein n=2 Tax=Phytophthora fragariae TaxID=53985 RepID=A0A6G0PPC2_9STRA|nr:hypothetical protein PF004_g2603 [Phytophthora fragariae]
MADQLTMEDPTTSQSGDHDRCGGKDSTSTNTAVNGVTTSNIADQWSFVDSDSGDSLVFDTMGSWTPLPLTEQVVQLALDAVCYKSNYARTVTTRFCLHYINSIRTRVTSGLIGYIITVDGCTSVDVVDTGRCDIYYCRPHVYEVQITQKDIGSTVFLVQSIYQTIDQKSLDEMRSEESNLDFSTLSADNVNAVAIQQSEVQSEQPLAWQGDNGDMLQGSEFFDDEEPIAWANDVNNLWDLKPAVATARTISLRAEPSAAERATGSDPGATLVAVVGIATVAVSTIAFVLALVIARFRARANAAKQGTMDQEYSPLRSTLNTAENTISITSRDSIAADIKSDLEKNHYQISLQPSVREISPGFKSHRPPARDLHRPLQKDPKDDNMQLNAMAAAANFKEVPLTPDVIQEALDAVRYKKNYNRAVTSRFCLHYIDKISTRVINKLVNYLISVDGCESSTVVDSGICDINNCKPKPYTYELKLEQKAAGSYDFGVTSIYKNVDQPRSSDEIRNEPSNLDIPELPLGEAPVVIENPPAAEIPYLIPDVFWPEGSFLGQEIPVIEQPNPATTPENPVIVPETESESPAFVPASPVQWQSPAFVPETPATEPESPVTVPDTEADELEEWSGGSEEPVDWAANDLWWNRSPNRRRRHPFPSRYRFVLTL